MSCNQDAALRGDSRGVSGFSEGMGEKTLPRDLQRACNAGIANPTEGGGL